MSHYLSEGSLLLLSRAASMFHIHTNHQEYLLESSLLSLGLLRIIEALAAPCYHFWQFFNFMESCEPQTSNACSLSFSAAVARRFPNLQVIAQPELTGEVT